MASKAVAYSVALTVALSYSVWYILLSYVATSNQGIYAPLLAFFIIETVSALLDLIGSKASLELYSSTDIIYPVISGLAFVIGNYIFYIMLAEIGLPYASSFATAEIIVFSALLWFTSREKSSAKAIFGAAIIFLGLTLESLRLSNVTIGSILNVAIVEYGTLVALFYGIATFFYYLSTKGIKKKTSLMFIIQITEAIAFGMLIINFWGKISIPTNILIYTFLVTIAGIVVFFSFFLETVMMKMLLPLSKGSIATGYILSDLELIPVLAYSIYEMPSQWLSYTPGILLIVAGMVFLDWRRSQ